ncbi:MAG: hypothetical protein K2P78_02395 [Gemmataceae bacterium]|nr:hypothetical protein [Gemmataceae bacterium]
MDWTTTRRGNVTSRRSAVRKSESATGSRRKRNSTRSSTNSCTQATGARTKPGSSKSHRTSPGSSGGSGTGASWTTTQLSRNVHRIVVPVRENRAWEWWCLLRADEHWDSPKCVRQLLKKHLEQVVERAAGTISFGDTLDLMGGRMDRRSHKEGIRPEHVRDDYYDAVIGDAAKWYAPYAKHLILFGVGNHESAVTRFAEIHPIDRLVALLNREPGASVFSGGYSGWVVFQFKAERGATTSVTLNYHHGAGTGGVVTGGMLDHHRRAVIVPDADIVATSHTHDSWTREFARIRLTQAGSVIQDVQVHIKVGTYKNDLGDSHSGWAVEKGISPKPLGAWWLRFYWDRPERRVRFEVIRAQ